MKTMGVKQGVFFLQFSTTKGRRVPLAEKKYPLHQVPMKNMNIKIDDKISDMSINLKKDNRLMLL